MSIFSVKISDFLSQVLVCISWASKNFPRCLDYLKSKPLGSYTTPKYQKAISLLETISFSSNNSNPTNEKNDQQSRPNHNC